MVKYTSSAALFLTNSKGPPFRREEIHKKRHSSLNVLLIIGVAVGFSALCGPTGLYGIGTSTILDPNGARLANAPNHMEAQPLWAQFAIAILTGAVGLFSGVALVKVKAEQDLLAARDKEKAERERERAATRLNYLDPLLVSARDYAERLGHIQEKVESGGDHLKWMCYQFDQVKENPRTDLTSHIKWCNGEGYFAVSTNYLTAVYFFQATKLRREYATSALSPSEARTLLENVLIVRRALGGINGIWETLQDSAGDYVRCEDGTLLRYRKFCEQIFKVEERAYILRVLDFYREIHERTDEQRKRMIQSLNDLIGTIEGMGSSTK